jgi:hypothetical protein
MILGDSASLWRSHCWREPSARFMAGRRFAGVAGGTSIFVCYAAAFLVTDRLIS